MATIASLVFRMNSTYNGDGLAQARRDISRLDGSMRALDKSSSALVPGFKAMVSSIIMLGPALVPITAGIIGLGAAAGSAFVSAGAAAGVFAVAMKGAINATIGTGSPFKDTAQAITKAQKALDDAVPGTKAYEKATKDLAEAQKAHNDVIKAMPPVQEAFARGYEQAKGALSAFNDENAKFILTPATTMMEAFTATLPKLTGLLKAITPEMQRVADMTKRWVTDGGLDRFLQFVQKFGIPALHGFIDAARDLFAALGQGMRDTGPLGLAFVAWLEKTMQAFRGWAEGGGFQRFLEWLAKNKDQLLGIAKDLGQFMGNLGKALADMSGLALTNVGVLLKVLASFPPGLIEAIAYAWVAWNAILTIWNITAFVTSAAGTLMLLWLSPMGPIILGIALSFAIWLAALIALAVGIYFLIKYWDQVSAAFVTAWNATWSFVKDKALAVWNWLKDTWTDLWGKIKSVAMAVWNWLTTGWGQVLLFFMPFGPIILLAKNWETIWNGIKDVALTVWNALKTGWAGFIGPIKDAWNAVWPEMVAAAKNWWAVLTAAWQAVWGFFTTVWNAFWGVFGGSFKAGWAAIVAIATGVWDVLKSAWALVWSVIQGIYRTAWAILSGAWSVGWTFLTNTAKIAWAILTGAWEVIWAVVTGIWNTFAATFKAIFSSFWNVIVTAATGIWNVIKAAWDALWKVVVAIFLTFTAIFTGHWSTAWNAIKDAGNAIWNLIKTAWQAFLNTIIAYLMVFVNTAKAAWSAFWTAIQSIATTFWNAVRNLFSTFLAAIQALWNAAWTAARNIFQTIINAIVAIAQAFWNTLRSVYTAGLNAVQAVWNAVWTAIRTFLQTVLNALTTFIQGWISAIQGIFTTLSNWLRTTFWNPLNAFFTKTIPAAFESAKQLIGKAWDGIKKIVRDPIQAIVNVVYNNGIVKLWNAVAGVFGGKKLGEFHLPAFAEGGPTGQGSRKGFPAVLHPNEHVWTSAEVKAAGGHKQVAMLRAAVLGRNMNRIRIMGGPNGRFDDGGGLFGTGFGPDIGPDLVPDGIIKDIGGAISSAVSKLKNVVLGGVMEVIKAPINAAVKAAQSAVRAAIPGSPMFEDLAANIPRKLADMVLNWISDKDVAPAGFGGGTMVGKIPSGDHLKIINAALKAAGVPPPGTLAQWQKGLNTLITRESGWNPNAQNNWDSNAAAGMSSRGLAQVIPPTFASNHVPGTSSNIFDPVANVAAAIRYITRRYGNITNVQQANASLPPKGYGLGTPGANRGWATVGENGAERMWMRGGERVDPLESLIRRGGDGVNVSVQVNAPGATHAVVNRLNTELPEKLRMALEQGVGARP